MTSSRQQHQGLKLLERMSRALRARKYSPRTEQSYLRWVKRYVQYHQMKHPMDMGDAEINAFLTDLAVNRQVSASTQNQALSALLFLYRYVLHREIGELEDVIRAHRPHRLPVVMTRDEVLAVLRRLPEEKQLIAMLLYGSGLRLMECLRLRVKDIDFTTSQITIRDGKGNQDRVTMLPVSLRPPAGASRAGQSDPRTGSERRIWTGHHAQCPGPEISQRRLRMELAVDLPPAAALARS